MKAMKVMVIILMVLFPAVVLSATVEVTIDENGFSPSGLGIDKGDTIRWVNRGTSPHSATSGVHGVANGYFDSGMLNPGESFEKTFEFPEAVAYFDSTNTSAFGSFTIFGVVISPGSSVLIDEKGVDLIIISNVGGEIRIFVNDELILKGDFWDVRNQLPILSEMILKSSGFAWVISLPNVPIGVHRLRLEAYSGNGDLISADEAVYTVIAASKYVQSSF